VARRESRKQSKTGGAAGGAQSTPFLSSMLRTSTGMGISGGMPMGSTLGKSRSSPLIVWPMWLQSSDAMEACEGRKSELLEQARARDELSAEQRALNDEIAAAKREARTTVALQRAKTVAMQAERDELKQLATEAQHILELRELLAKAQADGSESPIGSASPLEAEAFLERERQAVRRRAQDVARAAARPPRLLPGAMLEAPTLGEQAQVTPRIQRIDSMIQASTSPAAARLNMRRPRRNNSSNWSMASPTSSTMGAASLSRGSHFPRLSSPSSPVSSAFPDLSPHSMS